MENQQYPPYTPQLQPPGKGLQVAGLVFGILSVVFCWLSYLCFILALLAIIFGAAGISKANKCGQTKGMGTAGLILGVISLVPAILVLVACSTAISSILSSIP